MSNKKEKKTCGQLLDEWKGFVWNPRTHEFLGRTASSWALILVFYLVFYTFLTGLFCLTMWVLLQTVDDYKPTYQDRLATPGLMIRPKCEALEIDYDIAKTESWDDYITALDSFLARESWCGERRRDLSCSSLLSFNLSLFFLFLLSHSFHSFLPLSPSSLLPLCHSLPLSPSLPLPFLHSPLSPSLSPPSRLFSPLSLKFKFQDLCWPDRFITVAKAGSMTSTCSPSLLSQVNYSQPLVAVKFLNITFNSDVNVECKIVARDIKVDAEQRDKFAGRVSFKLRINKS
nr:PREDICTED: sodium/potassium-transporting ATPase subunit beta-2-like [Lepisosteus oculatus]